MSDCPDCHNGMVAVAPGHGPSGYDKCETCDGGAAMSDLVARLRAETVSAEITNENLRAEIERLQAVIRTWPVGAWGWREAQKAIGEDPEETRQ